MRLQFLGTGGYHPNERRHTTCVMLPELGVIFDAGTGFFRVAERLQTENVQIYLSHAHLDHVVGLTYFIVPLLLGKVKSVEVFSGEQYLQTIREHLCSELLFPAPLPFTFSPLAEKIMLPDEGVLTYREQKHPGGSIGYRIDWPDRSLAFITDTTADGSYADFIRGVDVLIHECNFPDDLAEWAVKTGHSHTTPVAQLARDAGVGRLILTHIDPQRPDDDPIGLAIARTIFTATDLAEDLMEIEF